MPSDTLVETIRTRFERVLEQIVCAAQSVGRDSASVRLVVVTKTQPVEALYAAIAAGVSLFGENYAEEAAQKIQTLPTALEWHMLGHVQSRKADLVARHFHMLHSLDSLKLAQRLSRFAVDFGRNLPVLLEVNVSGEASKYGFAAWDETRWPQLLPDLEQIASLPNLQLRGLMTMPPFFSEAEPARPYFAKTRALQTFLAGRFPKVCWDELSMGTSADFRVAIQEGATLVRVGTAIMGPRVTVLKG